MVRFIAASAAVAIAVIVFTAAATAALESLPCQRRDQAFFIPAFQWQHAGGIWGKGKLRMVSLQGQTWRGVGWDAAGGEQPLDEVIFIIKQVGVVYRCAIVFIGLEKHLVWATGGGLVREKRKPQRSEDVLPGAVLLPISFHQLRVSAAVLLVDSAEYPIVQLFSTACRNTPSITQLATK